MTLSKMFDFDGVQMICSKALAQNEKIAQTGKPLDLAIYKNVLPLLRRFFPTAHPLAHEQSKTLLEGEGKGDK